MQIVWNLVLAVQIASAIAMIGLVLVQHGKGADMGASFGSGASGSLFGASGSANFLSRSTAVCATLFFACTLALAYSGTAGLAQRSEGSSVFERAGAASAPSAASAPAAQIPVAPVVPTAPSSVPSVAPTQSMPAPAASAPASTPQKP